MTAKWHESSTTGMLVKCTAKIKCRNASEGDHFTGADRFEAERNREAKFMESNSVMGTITKKDLNLHTNNTSARAVENTAARNDYESMNHWAASSTSSDELDTLANQEIIKGNTLDSAQHRSYAAKVRATVARNPYTARDTLRKLANDNDAVVVEAVAINSNTPIEVLEVIKNGSRRRAAELADRNLKEIDARKVFTETSSARTKAGRATRQERKLARAEKQEARRLNREERKKDRIENLDFFLNETKTIFKEMASKELREESKDMLRDWKNGIKNKETRKATVKDIADTLLLDDDDDLLLAQASTISGLGTTAFANRMRRIRLS